MSQTTWLPLLLLAAGLTGCATQTLDVPRADNYAPSSQKKARAVHHWDVLADDVAGRIADKLQGKAAGLPVSLQGAAEQGDFQKSFHKLLLNRLVERGVTVVTPSQPAVVSVRFDVQVVQHRSEAGNRVQFPMTALAAGIAVVRDLAMYQHSAAAGVMSGLAVGAALDGTRLALNGTAAGGPTRTEVLITTSAEQQGRYLATTADVYYIDGADAGLYSTGEAGKQWKVVGQ